MTTTQPFCRFCGAVATEVNPLRADGFCEDVIACWERKYEGLEKEERA